jgi:hypothetical protein
MVLLALPAPVSAQTVVPSPLLPRAAGGVDAMTGLPILDADGSRIRALANLSDVRMTGFLLPEGGTVDLLLTRVDLDRLDFGYHVDGLPAPGLAQGLDLSVWLGTVAGEPGSEAMLGFSNRGVHGFVRTGGEPVHVLTQPGDTQDWSRAAVVLAREADLSARGLQPGPLCAIESLAGGAGTGTGTGIGADGRAALDHPMPPEGSQAAGAGDGACSLWECRIAVETDFQFYSLFNDLGATTAYLTTLLASISARYEEQIDTVLTFPYVQFYTTSNDPWSTPDGPGSSGEMLDEFSTAWAGNIPGGAVLGHMVSGAGLGGGIAYLGVLCDTGQTASFAVSGNFHGSTPFPIAVGPLNWDFMVFAHETGHNFNSPHTHSYNPQIDNCAGGTCITNGTIMSYCHLCEGGLSNITTYFQEPTVVGVMQAHASSCLPLLSPLVADATAQPKLVAPAAPTPLAVAVQGTPVSGVDLEYRLSSGAGFTVLPMADQGGGTWTASLPAADCGDEPEWYFSMVDQQCGPYQTQAFVAEVGVSQDVLVDEFESASGWSVGSGSDDATSGVWTRGDPIGTGAQPENDVTAAGTDCWFTGQGSPGGSLGENDVDGGRTTLSSPSIVLAGTDARISYWRWYSNNAGSTPNTDVFEVEISANGTTWVDVETVGPAGPGTSGGWVYHEFHASDFVSVAGSVQVRFIASDEGEGSLVEAAVDAFKVYTVDCGVTCQASLGFAGPGTGTLSICGGDLSGGNPATLEITGAAPNATAVLLAGGAFGPTPFKGGTLVPVPFVLTVLLPLDGAGAVSANVPGGGGPLTLYVQALYADGGQALGFGITNALEVDLLP